LIMMLVSLLAALIKPDLALQPNYQGWVPALKVRLWGLGSNANSIGPLALVLLLLEFMQPSNRSWLRLFTWIAALVVLVLAQSKTVWASGFVVGLVILGYRRGRSEAGGVKLGFVLFIILLLLVGCLGLMFVDIERILQKLSLTQAGGDISTLTGRTQIWAVAIKVWEDAPLFGYGLSAWGAEHRSSIGLPFAFHAHNQLMQSLSVAGSVGAGALIVYFVGLWVAAWQAASRTRGVSLGLMLFISIRAVSEAPLELTGLFVGETFMHLLLFMIIVNNYNVINGLDRRVKL
jgi:O-antigen ligase